MAFTALVLTFLLSTVIPGYVPLKVELTHDIESIQDLSFTVSIPKDTLSLNAVPFITPFYPAENEISTACNARPESGDNVVFNCIAPSGGEQDKKFTFYIAFRVRDMDKTDVPVTVQARARDGSDFVSLSSSATVTIDPDFNGVSSLVNLRGLTLDSDAASLNGFVTQAEALFSRATGVDVSRFVTVNADLGNVFDGAAKTTPQLQMLISEGDPSAADIYAALRGQASSSLSTLRTLPEKDPAFFNGKEKLLSFVNNLNSETLTSLCSDGEWKSDCNPVVESSAADGRVLILGAITAAIIGLAIVFACYRWKESAAAADALAMKEREEGAKV